MNEEEKKAFLITKQVCINYGKGSQESTLFNFMKQFKEEKKKIADYKHMTHHSKCFHSKNIDDEDIWNEDAISYVLRSIV